MMKDTDNSGADADRPGGNGSPDRARISAHTWLLLAVVVGGVTLVGAYLQPVTGDAYHPKEFPSIGWWLYPQERFGYQRLDSIPSDLNAVCASDDGRMLWVAGKGGAIAASQDGGARWTKQNALDNSQQASLDRKRDRRIARSGGEFGSNLGAISIDPGPVVKARYEFDIALLKAGTTIGGHITPLLRTVSYTTYRQNTPAKKPFAKKKSPASQSQVSGGPAAGKPDSSNSANKNGPAANKGYDKQRPIKKPNPPAAGNRRPAVLTNKARSIAGHVRTPSGQPISGGRVRTLNGRPVSVLTGADGEYVLDNLEALPAFEIRVEKDGYIPATYVQPGGTASDVNFVLSALTAFPSESLIAIHFGDAKNGWAINQKGRVLATTNGGAAWQIKGIPFDKDMVDVDKLLPPDSGVRSAQLSGEGEVLCALVKHDGDPPFVIHGKTKIVLQSPDLATPTNITFLDEQRGWLIGPNGLNRTTNGGTSWTPVAGAATGEAMKTVHFANAATGWATDAVGHILKTTDEGVHWSTQVSGTRCELNAMFFLPDARRGWVVGNQGTVLSTSDGGETWIHLTQGTEGLDSKLDKTARPSHWPPPISMLGVVLSLALAVQAARAARAKPPLPEKGVADILVSDRPLEAGDADALDLNSIALGLSRFLRNQRTIPPLTMAITGEWGTGKSSLMNLLRADLRSYGFRPVWFNAWHHQKEEHLLASLLQCIRLQAVPRWWRPGGVAFRLRLLAMRGRRHWVPWLLLLLAFSAFAGREIQELRGKTLQDVLDFALNLNATDLYNYAKALSDTGTLGFLVALIGVGRAIWKGATAFGMNPASLIASVSSGSRLRDLDAQTSFRQKFAEEFSDVTSALGARSMLILIDDLDRCRPEHVLEVLEAINFLVSSGECFVVIGMARGRVEGCVGLSFKDVAAELYDGAVLPAKIETSESAKLTRREFARQYLDKLINIEVPVPLPSPEQARLLLVAKKKEIAHRSSTAVIVDKWKRRGALVSGPLAAVLACAITIGAGYYLGNNFMPVTNRNDHTGGQNSNNANASLGASADSNQSRDSAANENKTAVSGPDSSPEEKRRPRDKARPPVAKDQTKNDAPPPVVSPAAEPGPEEEIIPAIPSVRKRAGYGLIPIALIGCTFVALYVFNRRPDLIVEDSPEFEKALEIWFPLVVARENTPRGMKRFVNRVRYLAMRQQSQTPSISISRRLAQRFGLARGDSRSIDREADQIPESVIVALTAMRTCDPNWLQDDKALVLPLVPGDGANALLLREAKTRHVEAFHNWDQLAHHRRRFLVAASGVHMN